MGWLTKNVWLVASVLTLGMIVLAGQAVAGGINPPVNTTSTGVVQIAGDLGSPVNGNLWYNTVTNKFRCHENSSSVDCIGGGGGTITGSGTNNTMTKWTGATSIGDSAATDDGTNLLYGGATIGLLENGASPTLYGSLDVADLTGARTYTLPDATGEVSLLGQSIDVASEITGVTPVANGGTNSSTALSGSSIMISNGTAVVQGAAGTTTTVLHGNAAGAPTYGAVAIPADTSTTFTAAHIPFSDGSNLTSESQFIYNTTDNTLQITDESGSQHADIEVRAFGAAGFGGRLIGVSCGGTAASPTATQSGDVLVDVVARGCDGPGSFTANASFFRQEANQTWSGSAMGTLGRFFGIDNGTTTFDTVVSFLGGSGTGSQTELLQAEVDLQGKLVNDDTGLCDGVSGTGQHVCMGDIAVKGRSKIEVSGGIAESLACGASATCGGVAFNPVSSEVLCSCTNGGGCNVDLKEANAVDRDHLYFSVSTNAAGGCIIDDVSEEVELSGGTTFTGGAFDVLHLVYATDRWIEVSRSDN